MKIYLARHGQTDWNLQHKAQGRTDIPLNATGIAQAELLRDNIKSIKFDVCYTSPLRRAAETATIAADSKCPIIRDNRLIERSYGSYEGGVDIFQNIGIDIEDYRLNASPNGVEPIQDLFARARDFVRDLKSCQPADATVLIITHNTFGRALHHTIVGYDETLDFRAFFLENAQAREYEL